MLVSVIIPTLNRSRLLMRTLLSLVQQDCPDEYEIIVVDNGSTDETRNAVENINKCFPGKVQYLYEARPGLLFGRNAGALKAQGDILSITDDDIIAPPQWIKSVYSVFADKKVSLATGNNFPFYEGIKPGWLERMWKYCQYGRILWPLSLLDFGSTPREVMPYFVWGLNYHIRKNILAGVGGFHPDILPDPENHKYLIGDGEAAISKDLLKGGHKAFFNPALSLYHTVTTERMTKEYFKKRSYWQGMKNSFSDIRAAIHDASYAGTAALNIKKARESLKAGVNTPNTEGNLQIEASSLENEMKLSMARGYLEHHDTVSKHQYLKEYIGEKDYYHNLDKIYERFFKILNEQITEHGKNPA